MATLKDTTINNNLSVSGDAVIQGKLSVTGDVSYSGKVEITDGRIAGNLILQDDKESYKELTCSKVNFKVNKEDNSFIDKEEYSGKAAGLTTENVGSESMPVYFKNGVPVACNSIQVDIIKEVLLNAIYPVGSIYTSVNETNPSVLFGGTWEALGGKFLIGANSTYTAGATGGSANAIVVSHSHTFNAGSHSHDKGNMKITGSIQSTDWSIGSNENKTTTSSGALRGEEFNKKTSSGTSSYRTYMSKISLDTSFSDSCWTGNTSSATVSGTTDSTGSSGTGANMPPYLAVYMWKRTE